MHFSTTFIKILKILNKTPINNYQLLQPPPSLSWSFLDKKTEDRSHRCCSGSCNLVKNEPWPIVTNNEKRIFF